MPAQGNPVYGAANAIVQSPVDPNTYWVATVAGGIWKTSDGGATWTATVSAGFLYQTAPVTALGAQILTAPTLAQTAPAGGAGAFADAGVYASLANWLTGFVRWHGEAREHANSNQVSGGLSVTF